MLYFSFWWYIFSLLSLWIGQYERYHSPWNRQKSPLEWQFQTKPTPSPAKVKPSLKPSPLECSRKLVYSPFLSAVAGKCEWSRLRTEPTPYFCFRIQMASLPAGILKKSSQSLTFSERYRDQYCPRHRDPHTGRTWRLRGVFFGLAGVGSAFGNLVTRRLFVRHGRSLCFWGNFHTVQSLKTAFCVG